jgi:outer membrane protein
MRAARLAAALSVLLGALAGEASAARYSLRELIAKVSRDYSGVRAAEASVRASQAQVAQAVRAWAPTGDVSFWITGAPLIRCSDASGFTSPNKTVREQNCIRTNAVDLTTGNVPDVLPFHGVSLNLSLNLTQPLYTFGKIEAATATARAGVDAARANFDAARAEVVWNAVRAYWAVKWAKAASDTLAEGIDKLTDWTRRIDEDLSATPPRGGYSEGDLARLKVALDNAKVVQLDLSRGLLVALTGLRVLTGDEQADVDEAELELIDVAERPMSFWMDAAYTHRPEARLLDASVAAAHGNRRWKLADMLPDLGLVTNANFAFASSVDTPQNAFMSRLNGAGVTLLLALRTPIDWGIRYGRFEQARAEEVAAVARREQALGGISIEVGKAWADANEARARAEMLNHGAKVSRGWYNAMDQNLRSGLITDGRELVEAARSYFDFRIRYLQAIMDTNIQLAWLRRTSGLE